MILFLVIMVVLVSIRVLMLSIELDKLKEECTRKLIVDATVFKKIFDKLNCTIDDITEKDIKKMQNVYNGLQGEENE